jgi:hypothetical protein
MAPANLAAQQQGGIWMLIYVDAAKFIKIYRSNESSEGSRRIRLGSIAKRTYEFRADENAAVTDAERAELETVVESYKAADAAKVRAHALAFPEIARQVAEYYAEHATEVEKRLISVAVLEMARAIRKADKGEAAPEAQAA